MSYQYLLGEFGACSIEADAFPNCEIFTKLARGDWQAAAVVTSYYTALQAAHAKDKSKYDTHLAKGDNYRTKFTGRPIDNYFQGARSKLIRIAAQTFARSDAETARYARGFEVRSSGPQLSTDIPSGWDIWGQAASQTGRDIRAGDPFRGAREGGYLDDPSKYFRDAKYAVTGDEKDLPPPGSDEVLAGILFVGGISKNCLSS